jgi:DNA-binding transcriptional regulator YdaS (Cro superfamily)
MDKLLHYINSLSTEQQEDFAARCGTSIGYIRKGISTGQQFGEKLCINFDRESGGAVRVDDLRPDVDWAHVRKAA